MKKSANPDKFGTGLMEALGLSPQLSVSDITILASVLDSPKALVGILLTEEQADRVIEILSAYEWLPPTHNPQPPTPK